MYGKSIGLIFKCSIVGEVVCHLRWTCSELRPGNGVFREEFVGMVEYELVELFFMRGPWGSFAQRSAGWFSRRGADLRSGELPVGFTGAQVPPPPPPPQMTATRRRHEYSVTRYPSRWSRTDRIFRLSPRNADDATARLTKAHTLTPESRLFQPSGTFIDRFRQCWIPSTEALNLKHKLIDLIAPSPILVIVTIKH